MWLKGDHSIAPAGNRWRLSTHGVLCAQGEEGKRQPKEKRLTSKDGLEQQTGSITGGLEQTVTPSTSSSGNLYELPYKDAPCSDVGIMESPCFFAQAAIQRCPMQSCRGHAKSLLFCTSSDNVFQLPSCCLAELFIAANNQLHCCIIDKHQQTLHHFGLLLVLDEICCTHITASGHSYARLGTCSGHLAPTAGHQTSQETVEGPCVQQSQQADSVRVPRGTFKNMLEMSRSGPKAREMMAGGAGDAAGWQVQP